MFGELWLLEMLLIISNGKFYLLLRRSSLLDQGGGDSLRLDYPLREHSIRYIPQHGLSFPFCFACDLYCIWYLVSLFFIVICNLNWSYL